MMPVFSQQCHCVRYMKNQSTNGHNQKVFSFRFSCSLFPPPPFIYFVLWQGLECFLGTCNTSGSSLPFTYVHTYFRTVPFAVILILAVGLGVQNLVWFCTSKFPFGFPLRSLFWTWHVSQGISLILSSVPMTLHRYFGLFNL